MVEIALYGTQAAAADGTDIVVVKSETFEVALGEPSGEDPYLRSTDIIVGTTTYNTTTATAPGSPPTDNLDTATASLASQDTDVVLQDAANISMFVSDPVPSGKTWNLNGTWTYNAYMRTNESGGTRLYMRAKIYKVNSSGSTLLATSGLTTRRDVGSSFGLISWTYAPSGLALLNSGERYAIELYMQTPDGGQTGNAILGFNCSTSCGANGNAPSSYVPYISESAAGPSLRASHWRIGKDNDPNAMQWYGSTDTAVTNLPKDTHFRVRTQMFNEGGSAKVWTPLLQWSSSPGSGYATVPLSGSCGTNPFCVTDTTSFTNGAAITSAALGTPSNCSSCVWQSSPSKAYDTNNPAGSTVSLGAASYGEVEFNIRANSNAVDGNSYYFRLTDNSTAFSSYDTGVAQVVISWPAIPTPTVTSPAHNQHVPYTSSTAACAGCHRAHVARGPQAIQKAWPEEQVCYTCHDGTGAPNIKAQFEKTYKMPITSTEGVHSLTEARTKDSASFRDGNRHLECTDCHNPHLAGAGTHPLGGAGTAPSNYAYGPLQGMWGISVENVAAWAAPTFTTVEPVQYEYQVCFKCHSSWAYGTNPPTWPSGGGPETDQSKEFNTLNPSFHPVEGPGKNPMRMTVGGTTYDYGLDNGSGSFIQSSGLSASARITCTDCHRSETDSDYKGPHGSTIRSILRGTYDRTTGRMPGQKVGGGPDTSNHLCFKCHNVNVYANPSNTGSPWDTRTGFSGGGKNLHAVMVGARNKSNGDQAIVCMDCHVAVPHGWQRDHFLGFTGDGSPYINRPYSGGLTTIDTWRTSGNWTFDSCSTAMGNCR